MGEHVGGHLAATSRSTWAWAVTGAELIPEFFAALRRAVPAEPPAVSVVVTDALAVEGASVAVDGVALVAS